MAGKSFLVIRLSSLGDIVHALPAVSALAQMPSAGAVDWLIETRYRILLNGNPYLRNVIEIDTLGTGVKMWSLDSLKSMLNSVSVLRGQRYDAVVDLQSLFKTAVLTRCARAQERVGFAGDWAREPMAGIFYTQKLRIPRQVHVIQANLSLIESLGAQTGRWEFPLPDGTETREGIENKLRELGVREYIIVNPGGGWAAKRWSPENYGELVGRLGKDASLPIVLSHGPGEEQLVHDVLQRAGTSNAVTFPTDILQFIALARRAKLFIGTDTGPLHLSTALGTPVVGIYGPTDPATHGPFSPADIVLRNSIRTSHSRRGRDSATIEGVSVEAVLEAVRERLAGIQA